MKLKGNEEALEVNDAKIPTEEVEKKSTKVNMKKEITIKAIKQNLDLASELICFCSNCIDRMLNEGNDTCEASGED